MRQFTNGQRFLLPSGENVKVKIVLRPASKEMAFTTMDRVEAVVEVQLVPASMEPAGVYQVARNGEIVPCSEPKSFMMAIDVDDLEEVTA